MKRSHSEWSHKIAGLETILKCVVVSMLLILPEVTDGENILVVNFMNSKSVKNFYETLYLALADRGHNLTIISPFKTTAHPRIRDIIGTDIFSGGSGKDVSFNAFEDRLKGQSKTPLAFTPVFAALCRSYYEMPEVQELLDGGQERFDLILATYTFNECGFGLIHRLQVPFILLHANVPLPWNNPTGVPYPLSHNPLPYFGYTDDMTFSQRLVNFVVGKLYAAANDYWSIPQYEVVYRQFVGQDTPSVDEISKNVSLIFSNSHYSLNFPRETMPDVIEIGGMHCRSAKPLPKDLQEFLDSAEGSIFFSLGSIVKADSMPNAIRQMFLRVFSKLDENVLWKWESEEMSEELPKNVKLGKWLPQQDILAHSKVRLFITHGGLHSLEEAVYHGTPVIGMPFYGDQDANMKIAEYFGFALTLQLTNLTEEIILNSIQSVLTNNKYRDNAQKMSQVFKDRLDSPLDTAIFWTEYVLRNKGAHHLKSPARHLSVFAYHSIDVILTIFLSLVTAIFLIYKTVKFIVCSTRSSKQNKTKRNNITLVNVKKRQ